MQGSLNRRNLTVRADVAVRGAQQATAAESGRCSSADGEIVGHARRGVPLHGQLRPEHALLAGGALALHAAPGVSVAAVTVGLLFGSGSGVGHHKQAGVFAAAAGAGRIHCPLCLALALHAGVGAALAIGGVQVGPAVHDRHKPAQ